MDLGDWPSIVELQGIAERVILHDRLRVRAEGEAWDIDDTTPLLHEGTVLPTDDYRDLADSDVVVVTVGANIKAGQLVKRCDRVDPPGVLPADVRDEPRADPGRL